MCRLTVLQCEEKDARLYTQRCKGKRHVSTVLCKKKESYRCSDHIEMLSKQDRSSFMRESQSGRRQENTVFLNGERYT